jgi:MFS transporter, MHS family, citrate/tricarballylate:H+ symporter
LKKPAAQEDASELKRRHIAAATIGNALEFYDFLTYAFFSIQIGHSFFPAQSAYGSLMLSLATFGAGFITRPVGAFVIGNYSDRVGRKPAMMLCFVLIGCAIVGMALIPTYAQIGIAAPILAVTARMIQGFSLGGEIGCNTAFLLEAAPVDKRGLIVSLQGASQLLALITGGLVGVLLTTVLPADALDSYGWRIAFLLGAATVPFGFWLRTNLPETLHTPDATNRPVTHQSRGAEAYSHWRIFLLSAVVLGSMTIATYLFSYVVTYSQATLHLPARIGFIATTGGYALGIAAVLYGGWLSDKCGRRPVNVWGNLIFLMMIYPAFRWITSTHSEFAFIVSMTVLNGVSNFTQGSFYAALAESLPKSIRGSGFGVVYSISIATFGGTTQLVVTWLIHVTGSAMAPAWYMLGSGALGQIALMLMAESAPVQLAPLPHPQPIFGDSR